MIVWSLLYETFIPAEQKLREALCTMGNGYFCTRGAAPEAAADEVHYPGTYLAGGYNRLESEIHGRTIENEDLVNLPNWLPLTFRPEGGEWFDLRQVELLSYRQELDIRRGVLSRNICFRDEQDRITRVEQRCFVHQRRRHLAGLKTVIEAENWSGSMEFRAALDGRMVNDGVDRYRGLSNQHLVTLAADRVDEDTLFLKVQTNQSELRVALAARTRIFRDDQQLSVARRTFREPSFIGEHFSVEVQAGKPLTVEKIVTLFTSRDEAISECGLAACQEIARTENFAELLEGHNLAWDHLWDRFDMKIGFDGPQELEQARTLLHLHMFHLLQSVSLNTIELDVGVPSRGWHGEAYRGHIFWDELFIFPLLNLRMPEVTRTLLRYRYRRLNEARAAAREAGLAGAMFPWQSGSNGREESQKIHYNPASGRWIPDNSRLQRHVNAAIAYNVWQYYQVTGDLEFMLFYGAEMLLEIARFWASIATWNETLDRYEIHGVMGPDEYHDGYPDAPEPGLNNNAYTNLMVVWVLVCARKVFDILPEERRQKLREALGLEEREIEQWDEISRKMRLVFHDDGIISQFEGYADLEELDWDKYHRQHGDVMRLDRILEAENDTPNRYKCSKQADVLMLFYLFSADELRELFQRLGYPFEYETIPKNIAYYLKRTSHGSTLSQVVHSWVLSRSDREGSWKLFSQVLHADYTDIQGGTTPEGIHLGAMAGSVDLVQRCFVGIETRADELRFNPLLPREISCLRLVLRYRGQAVEVFLDHERLQLNCTECGVKPIRIGFREQIAELCGGDKIEFML
jgi:alpha,alpha-trehalase